MKSKNIFELIDNFIISQTRNEWLDDGKVKIYIRKSKRFINSTVVDVLDLATIEIKRNLQKKGLFKEIINYLHQVNPFDWLMIENAHNPIVSNYCIKREFVEIPNYPICYFLFKSNKLC